MTLAENQGQRAKLKALKQKVTREAMPGGDFIIELFGRIDGLMKDVPAWLRSSQPISNSL